VSQGKVFSIRELVSDDAEVHAITGSIDQAHGS
jgi:hypothetical protein